VWLDDRRRCRWALRGLDLVVDAGAIVALRSGPDDGGPDAVLELLAGRRRPVAGSVRGASRDAVEVGDLHGGERRLCLPDGTTFVVRPTPWAIAMADLVVDLDDGLATRPLAVPAHS
jgi:hypothetical protein